MQNDTISQIIQLAGSLRETGGIESKSKREQVKYLCKLTGLRTQDLAMALIFNRPEIEVSEIAKILGVSAPRLYQWPNVSRTLRARNARDYDLAVKSDEVADYRGRNER